MDEMLPGDERAPWVVLVAWDKYQNKDGSVRENIEVLVGPFPDKVTALMWRITALSTENLPDGCVVKTSTQAQLVTPDPDWMANHAE